MIKQTASDGLPTIICGRWNRHCAHLEETRTLHATRNRFDKGEASLEELRNAQDAVTRTVIRLLDESGVSIIGDGDIRWDSIFDISRNIHGCGGFQQLTRIPKTNHFHRQPNATLPLSHRPLKVDDLRFAQQLTQKPITITLPGPYALALQTENFRDIGFQELGNQYADVLNREIELLLEAGAAFVRIEEPHIIHHPHEFELFRALMHRLTRAIDPARIILATWYGSVNRFKSYFELPFGIFWLDFVEGKENTAALASFPDHKRLIAGIFDARGTYQETDEELIDLLRRIMAHVPHDRLMISTNTDLHFLPWDSAREKINRIVTFAQHPHIASSTTTRGISKTSSTSYSFKENPPQNTALLASKAPRPWLPRLTFPTSAVGSYPQHPDIRAARVKLKKGELDDASYRTLVEEHTRRWMQFQESIDMTVPVGGELLREDMAVYFSEAFGGRKLDFVPSYENRRYRPIEFFRPMQQPNTSLLANDFQFLQSLTNRPVKETITGPATLADWALLRHPEYYHDRRTLRLDLAKTLHREIGFLVEAGVKILQVDEPALTTNMDNLDIDVAAIAETIRGYDNAIYLILHLCYSDMNALSEAFPRILKLPFHQIHMEMANRNYSLLALIEKYGFADKDIGLGVIDVHTDRIETSEEIVSGVQKVLPHFSPQQIWLTPDCGLKERTDDIAQAKLHAMCDAARVCRQRFGS